jgi:5-formyltetrahydrofolate cyclo-ligase
LAVEKMTADSKAQETKIRNSEANTLATDALKTDPLETDSLETDSLETRKRLRKLFRNKRLSLSKEQQTQAAQQLVKQFQQLTLFHGAQNVALYLSFNGEINTQPLIDYLWSIKCRVFVPILHPFCKGHLLFQEFSQHTPMHKNHFGISEPKLDAQRVCPLENLDILFTPLVAFDLTGNRLGMGGGFYDRTLAGLVNENKSNQAIVVGLAHELQLTSTLPSATWDIGLPYVLTSNKLYCFL